MFGEFNDYYFSFCILILIFVVLYVLLYLNLMVCIIINLFFLEWIVNSSDLL